MLKRVLALSALVVGGLAVTSAPAGALVECTPAVQGTTVCATVLDYEPTAGDPNAVTAGVTVKDPTDTAEVFYGRTYCAEGLYALYGYFVGLQCSSRPGAPVPPSCGVVLQEPPGVNLLYYVIPVSCPPIAPAPPPTL